MMEREKWSGRVECVDTESLVPQRHLLRKVDRSGRVQERLYEIVEPCTVRRGRTSMIRCTVQDRFCSTSGRDTRRCAGTLPRAQNGHCVPLWFLGYTLNEELPHFSTVSL